MVLKKQNSTKKFNLKFQTMETALVYAQLIISAMHQLITINNNRRLYRIVADGIQMNTHSTHVIDYTLGEPVQNKPDCATDIN